MITITFIIITELNIQTIEHIRKVTHGVTGVYNRRIYIGTHLKQKTTPLDIKCANYI